LSRKVKRTGFKSAKPLVITELSISWRHFCVAFAMNFAGWLTLTTVWWLEVHAGLSAERRRTENFSLKSFNLKKAKNMKYKYQVGIPNGLAAVEEMIKWV